MRTLTIDFTSAKLLPEGSDAGYIGEHNATQLKIIPPVEMAECESIATYVVAFATGRGVLYSDSFLKSEEITVSLTAKLTTDYYLGVQLEGYDSEGELVVKSPLVTQLQLSPSARGTGCENDGATIEGGFVSAGHTHDNKDVLDLFGTENGKLTFDGDEVGGSPDENSHSHENKSVLDGLSADGDNLLFNGKNIGGGTGSAVLGSKYYANNWGDGLIIVDAISSGTVDFLINEDYPENRIITDILVHINEGGTVEQYSFARLYSNGELGGTSAPFICSKPELNSAYSLYTVAFISNLSATSSNFYSRLSISDTAIEGFTVRYMEV